MDKLSTFATRLRIALTAIVLVVFIIFLVQNTEPIPMKILFLDVDLPGAILVLVTALVGVALGYWWAFTGQRRRRKRREARDERRQAESRQDAG